MKENLLSAVKEYKFDKPKSYEKDYILEYVIEDCSDKYFHSFEYRSVYDIKITIIVKNSVNI